MPATAANTPDSLPATIPSRLRLNYARNLAAMQRERPDIAAALGSITIGDNSRYRIELNGSGETGRPGTPTLLRRDGSTWSSLSLARPGQADPLQPYRAALAAPVAKALCGMGDGTLLEFLTANNPAPANSAPIAAVNGANVIYLIEPDLELFAHCMMLRDMTGPRSAIADKRVVMFIGPSWRKQLEAQLFNDPLMVDPGCILGQGPDAAEMSQRLKQITTERAAQRQRDTIAAQEHASSLDQTELAALLGPNPPRPPRVLLLTSRHTTVLQYSTRDAAEGFAELGWQTHVLIEREAYHVMRADAIVRAIAQFEPDVLFTIDHLRSELPCVPRELPFICWIQDNLPNLTSTAAGASVQRRDFVIGPWVSNYIRRHGYPARQCIAMPRLTQPVRREIPLRTCEDIVYVSNHSQLPQHHLTSLLAQQREVPGLPGAAALMRETGERMIDLYSRDGCLREQRDVRGLIMDTARELDIEVPPDADIALAEAMKSLVNLLYRQQALRWMIDIANQRGLTIGLYGKGWDRHPQYSQHARGVIAYGRELESLTRSAKINLQVEPFAPTAHQRLLDGLAAGGFFLCRQLRPHEHALRQFASLMCTLDESVASLEQAQAALSGENAKLLEQLRGPVLDAAGFTAEHDPITVYRQPRYAGLLSIMNTSPLPPRYFDVAFVEMGQLRSLVDRFIDDDEARRAIAAEQRAFVEQRFSYARGLGDVTRAMSELISGEA